jgi:transcriptional regulator with XRE-family HTH domain
MKFNSLKSSFAVTRARLGLSQQQLADHLGVAKATIGMAEIGRRKLPVPALLKLAELEIKMAAASIPGTVAAAKEADSELPLYKSCKYLQLREMECQLKIQRLSSNLEWMEANYKKYQSQLQLLNGMIENGPGKTDNRFMLCMQLHREKILAQLSKCSLTEQMLTRNKIALLSAESHLNRSVRQAI